MVLVHLFVAPYTKVEESFNVQALHDIIVHGVPLSNASAVIQTSYDHVNFPGVVPRTFVGSLIVAAVSTPFVRFLTSPDQIQILVRGVLGLINVAALWSLKYAVDTAYGVTAGRWFVVMQTAQFHVMFYASRTLPNMFAFPLVLVAQRLIILGKSIPAKSLKASKRRRLALYLLTIAGVIFRSEIAILLALETSIMMLHGRASLAKDIVHAGLVGIMSGLLSTVAVDSIFWQHFPLWPEWTSFYYNTVLGKSSDWGVEPFSYYFVDALPRLLMNPATYLLCLPMAMMRTPTRKISLEILLPHVLFITTLSLLPHKELRFIIYSVPAFTAVASSQAAWFWNRRSKTIFYRSLSFLMVVTTMASFLASTALLYISSLNYPGGEALRRLHDLTAANQHAPMRVYLDNLACQTGVNRFQEIRRAWVYDKTENETRFLEPSFWDEFDYVLAENPSRVIGHWESFGVIEGYAGVTLRPQQDQDLLPLPHSLVISTQWIKQLYSTFATFGRSRLTRGLWPTINLKPKIYLLRKEIPSFADHHHP